MEKHFLASANALDGFVNNFNYINLGDNKMTYILKGGPGTGKSTFMKKVAEHFVSKGFSVEKFYCSSDSSSLDGVTIVEKNIAIVDGTAPHVTEAEMPGITEKIVNVGEYIGGGIAKHKQKIEKLLAQKSLHYKLAYSYLRVAKELVQMENFFPHPPYKNSKVDKMLVSLNGETEFVQERKLFLSFLDKNGIQCLKIMNKFNVVNLNAKDYFSASTYLKYIANELSKNGVQHIEFVSLLDKSLLEGVYIEQNNTLIYNNILPEQFRNYEQILRNIKLAGEQVALAKENHMKVEDYYVKYVDFDQITKLQEKIIAEIENQ